jgi:hypothetical protein
MISATDLIYREMSGFASGNCCGIIRHDPRACGGYPRGLPADRAVRWCFRGGGDAEDDGDGE